MGSRQFGKLMIGEAIRAARLRRRLSQAQFGRLIGYSASMVSRFESGESAADMETLRSIALVLSIPPESLGLAADTPSITDPSRVPHGTATLMPKNNKDGGLVVPLERRGFLAGVTAAVGLGRLGPRVGAAGSRTCPDDLVAALEQALYSTAVPDGPLTLWGVQSELAIARSEFHASSYQALGERLPRLLATARALYDSNGGTTRERASALLADTLALSSEWSFKQHQDALAWVYADRAFTAACRSGDLTSTGEAARQLAIAMRRAGHYDAATQLLVDNARSLDTGRGDTTNAALAVYGSLLLTASYSEAQHGRRTSAEELLGEAGQAALRLSATPNSGSFAASFGLNQVNIYAIGVQNALGEPGVALEYARQVRPERLSSPERRARYAIDTARAYRSTGDTERCYRMLLSAEHLAPEEVNRPSVRAIAADLLFAPGPAPTGLREFAQRLGVQV
jgi:transcriptional regulator with XRE-family HTH domain